MLVLASGCGRGPVFSVPFDPCADDPDSCTSSVTLQRAADILFVIDNSGSMGDEQGTLARNFPAFIDVLEDARIGASYRIGLSTSDLSGLRASSCRARLDEFVFMGLDGVVLDEQAGGCLDSCAFDQIELSPTTTADDPNPTPRPWLEKDAGQTNLPGSVSMGEALRCLGPQGINGLGFEAPLESMRHALLVDSPDFIRDEALLAVIFVTDEADCSMSFDNRETILSDFGRPLWSDPEGDRPTSAVCWNAGVSCEGGPGVYDTCSAQDKDFQGRAVDDPQEAVLYPLERYVDTLRDIAAAKESRGGTGQVLVGVLAGVPEDYPQTGELVYRDSADPQFNLEYGIGPGCDWGTETIDSPPGIPPVRLREFAQAFETEGRNMFSVCSDNYAVALEQIATALQRLTARSCVPGCVADTAPEVDGLQYRCSITEEGPGMSTRDVPPCAQVADAWDFPLGSEICFRALDDAGGVTTSQSDDMSAQCVTRGSNLEFVVERRDDQPAPPGVGFRVDCRLAGPREYTCEELEDLEG